jgi:hypothetical protein
MTTEFLGRSDVWGVQKIFARQCLSRRLSFRND